MSENITDKVDERIYKLSRPFVFEEVEYTELVVDFDKLTGNDMIKAEQHFRADSRDGTMIFLKESHKPFLAYIVATAADVHPGVIKAMPIKDFSELTLRAQNFLLG